MQHWAKEHATEQKVHLSYNLHIIGLVERKNEIIKQQNKLLRIKTISVGCTKLLPHALIHLNDEQVRPVAPYVRLRTPAETPSVIRNGSPGEMPLPWFSPWINVLCCWKHQASSNLEKVSSTEIYNGMSHQDGWVTSHSWVRRNCSISTEIPLSHYKVNLLKCTIPGMEHAPLKEGRWGGSWSGISCLQSIFSCLTVPSPPINTYGTYNQVKLLNLPTSPPSRPGEHFFSHWYYHLAAIFVPSFGL